MEIFLEILKFTLPALVVFAAVWVVLSKLLRNESERRYFELRKQTINQTVPVRLRALERLTLLLERTQPEAMIMRLDLNGMTNLDLQTRLLKTIRDEYDHNVSQQIYVSNECWALVKSARENLVRVVNAAAAQTNPSESAMLLAQTLIKMYASLKVSPTDLAINSLKNELNQL